MNAPRPSDGERGDSVDRRTVLSALGVGSVGALAGCGGIGSQSFEATPVGLSTDDRESLWFGETENDAETAERDALGGAVSVSVTSHTSVYSRAAGLGGR